MKFIALLSVCLCMYREEAGVNDWHQQHVGIVDRIARSSDGILLSTRQEIVALMDNHGKIKWRRQLDGAIDDIIRSQSDNIVLKSSDQGHILYCFDDNGFRRWNVDIGAVDSRFEKMIEYEKSLYLLYYDRLIKIENSQIAYTIPVEYGFDVVFLDKFILIAQSSTEDRLKIQVIDKDGHFMNTLEYGVEIDITKKITVLSGSDKNKYLVFTNTRGNYITKLGVEKDDITPFPESKSNFGTMVSLEYSGSNYPAGIILVTDAKIVLATIKDGNLRIVSNFEAPAATNHKFYFNNVDNSTVAFTMVAQENEKIYYESIFLRDGIANANSDAVKFDFDLTGDIKWASIEFTAKGEENIPTIVVGTSDDSFHYISATKKWTMEESLTDTSVSVLVDIPFNLDKPVDLMKLIHESLKERIDRHYADFFEYVRHFSGGITNGNNQLLLSHDRHGFKKLAIFGSRNGKVVAIETDKGRTVWERFFPNIVPKYLFVSRDSKSGLTPVITMVSAKKASQETILLLIDALTGKDFENNQVIPSMKTAGIVDYAALTNYADEDLKIRTVVIITMQSPLLFPSNAAIQENFIGRSFYYYLTPGIGSNFIQGFKTAGMISFQTWKIDFPDGEEIAAMALSDKSPVANVGRVLGDRRVLYKYLNPNLASILTIRRSGKESTLFSYLIDLVSGNIHEKHVHFGAGYASGLNGAVKTMICENFVVYTFWNFGDIETLPKSEREMPFSPTSHYEMVILELYQSETPDVRHDRFVNSNNRMNYSSFNNDRLESIGSSFVIENAVSAVGVTTTHAGITSREILVSFEHGILQGLSRKYLDPRRPVSGLTAEEKEEELVPYYPAIPIHGTLVITYYLQILGINRIQSVSTNLESTSVVVASGVDLFSTKRTPSKPFDTLSADFSYLQLIASIAVLSLAVFVTDRAVEFKRVREAWV